MTKKKIQKVAVSSADEVQAKSQLGRFHQIAQELHSSTNQEQAEAALTAITSMSEGAQVALLKALSREGHTDAADVLIAINELSPSKDIRKEARRSLIRLEQDRIYPQWEAPVDRTPAIVAQGLTALSTPTRFWKGLVTDSRDAGEVQLMLFWEQGDNYRDVRVLGFLLEFWHEGVKDFFTSIQSKRSVDKLIGEMQATVETLDCTLAKGRRLIQEALDVNKKHGALPHKDYRLHASLVNQLVLEAPAIDEEEEEEDSASSLLELNNLEPDQVVTGFVDAWSGGDYKFAYNLLATDSPLREGLTEEQWIERREAWAAEAQPARLKPNFLHEIEAQKTGIWLPNPFSRGRSTANKEFEAGWSLELADTSSLPLPEQPQATAVYQETGRHWFWTSYTLQEEEQGWRIQTMTDAGTNVQGLSIAELQKRIQEHDKRIEDITKKHQPTDPDADQYFLEILWRSMQAIYCDDALLKHLPLDQAIYLDASGRAIILSELERGLVYLERMAQQFPEQRGEALRQIAAVQVQLSDEFYAGEDEYDFEEDEEGAEERGQHFLELAEANLRESLNIDNSASGHILLADMLIESEDEEKLDEAEEHLLQAQALPTSQLEETLIESKLGDVYAEREHYEQALAHFQRVIEMDPNFSGAWYNIGQTQRMLENNEEAKAAFKRSITLRPDDVDSYAELVEIYTAEDQISEARDLLEEGLSVNPDSAHLLVLLSSTYFSDDPDHAEELLEEAEEIDPDLLIVQLYRQIFNMRKQEQRRQPSFRGKKRKKR